MIKKPNTVKKKTKRGAMLHSPSFNRLKKSVMR